MFEYAKKSLEISTKSYISFLNDPSLKHATEMSLASNLAGKAINITRTSIAHSISYPLTAKYKIPHGLACSFTIPKILDFNLTKYLGLQEQYYPPYSSIVVNKKPLLAHTIDSAFKSKMFEKVLVLTDSQRYANIAKKYGVFI